MRRIMRSGFMGVAAALSLVGAAYAVPVSAIAVSPSHFSLSIAWGPFGTATGSGAITGSATTDLTAAATNVSTVAGTGSFDVASFSTPGLVFGAVVSDNIHVDVTLPTTTSASGTNPFNLDLGGSVISIDSGQVIQLATPATLFDFSKFPALMTVPAGSLTTLDLGAGLWTVPFTTTSTLLMFGVPVNLTFGTDLTLQILPEPGTLVLLGVGLVGLAAVGARCRRV
jgi:hypothetical protein